MTLEPLLAQPFQIQFHVAAALIALCLGPIAVWRRKRDRLHKFVGYVWVLGMGAVALSALVIPSHFTPIGLGPIHLLALYALYGLFVAMRAVYRKDIATHRDVMRNLYLRGLLIASCFNFLPGRSFQRMAFPEHPDLGIWVVAALMTALFLPQLRGFFKAGRNSDGISLEAPRGLR